MTSIFSRSAVQSILEPIDCRRLTMFVRFADLERDAVSQLTGRLLQWIRDTAEDSFCFRWHENRKSTRAPDGRIDKAKDYQLEFDAYVHNPVTRNPSSILRYQKSLRDLYPQYAHIHNIRSFADSCSVDYPPYFDTLFPVERLENDRVKENILKIFHESERRHLSFHEHPDLFGRITAEAHESNPQSYYGFAHISFSAFCLDGTIDCLAEKLELLACNLSESFVRLNIHVCLQPWAGNDGSPYMRYFGKGFAGGDALASDGHLPEEWDSPCYLRGVEWLNILSPLTKQLVGKGNSPELSADVQTRILSSGALLVRSVKSITQYSVADALALKRMLQPALYPGMAAIPLRGIYPWKGTPRVYAWCPRRDWAIVPVEESDVEIVGTDIVFCAQT